MAAEAIRGNVPDLASTADVVKTNTNKPATQGAERNPMFGVMNTPFRGNLEGQGVMTPRVMARQPVALFSPSTVDRPGVMMPSSLLPEGMNGKKLNSDTSKGSSSEKPQKYSEYGQHPADVIYWSTVVLPRFKEAAYKNLYGKSEAEKQEYVGGLVDAYHIVETHPDNILDQQTALRRIGITNIGYLDQVRDMMPDLQVEKDRIFTEAQGRSYRKNKRLARKAQSQVQHEVGKDEVMLVPESPGLPLEMVTNLAILDSMMAVFTNDAKKSVDENPKYKSLNKKNRKGKIADEVKGLLTAYVTSEATPAEDLPESSAEYMDRLRTLRDELDTKKEKITKEAASWTSAQQRRHIIKARKHFEPFTDIISLKEQTGLSSEMVQDIKLARRKEYAASTAWMAAVEVPQLASGWAGGVIGKEILDTKSLAALALLAGTTRVASTALLAAKGYYAEKLVDQKGIAPDTFSKATKEKWGKAWPGFTAYHGLFELIFTLNAALGIPTLGWPGALSIESATNLSPWGIPRQIVEVRAMRRQVKNGESSSANTSIALTENPESDEKTASVLTFPVAATPMIQGEPVKLGDLPRSS